MRNGGTCVHEDDMRGILEEILASDLLIWSFPLYCYGMPAPLKALLAEIGTPMIPEEQYAAIVNRGA